MADLSGLTVKTGQLWTDFTRSQQFVDKGKMAKAEQMYQRTLKGYENALRTANTTTYLPALNTIQNLSSLFEGQSNIKKARIMYLETPGGYKKAVGANDSRYQSLRDRLRALDAITENGYGNSRLGI